MYMEFMRGHSKRSCDGYRCLLYVNSWLILRCQKEQRKMNRSIMCAVPHIKSKHHLSIQVILEAWKWQILVSMNIRVDTWSNSASLPVTISTSTTRLTCILIYERESLLSGLIRGANKGRKANKGREPVLSENTFPWRPCNLACQ